MAILTAVVVLVGLLCLVDLLLTVAVIRRLRDHTERLAALEGSTATDPYAHMVAVGSPIPAFEGRAIDGSPVSAESVRPELVAFLSTGCSACSTELPALVELLGSTFDAAKALAVVAGPDNAEAARFVEALGPVATVVREPFDGPVVTAFNVDLYPSMYLVTDGTVRVNGGSVRRLVELGGLGG